MRLHGLDLNLLIPLQALLEERNVTRAGEKIGMSQPTMSAALARLRRHFDDDLLVRQGRRYSRTALADALLPLVYNAIACAERAFGTAQFDAESSTREFSLMMSDYALAVLGGELTRQLAVQAPGARLNFLSLPRSARAGTDTLLRQVDFLVLPRGFYTGYPADDLFVDRWVGLVCADNTEVGARLTASDLARLEHVAFRRELAFGALTSRVLATEGFDFNPAVVTDTFTSLPFLVEGTGRIALIQQRLAVRLCAAANVRAVDIDLNTGELIEAAWWHPANTADPAHEWLRKIISQVAQTID